MASKEDHKISKEEILHLAHLARLDLDEKAVDKMMQDMDKILAFVDKLNELDVEGVEPLKYMNNDTNVLRKDEVRPTISQTDALKNAPQKDTDYIKVPKVLKRSS
ncbi:MAG: Asp-tRNA(Asn)/Glu-tRNA(Gln) amidotransferase subunit GatC [Flavobacteriales bacterium]|nr:Asp-tRNA(Asn)/Glu-tRNA(Gln) amidotransferase subunit GatC [Flavobacteriales bacterium]